MGIGARWLKRGQRKRLPAPPGAKTCHHVVGALNWPPPHCPALNPIERFWRHMKDVAKANTLFATDKDMLERAEEPIKAQKEPGHKLRLKLSHD